LNIIWPNIYWTWIQVVYIWLKFNSIHFTWDTWIPVKYIWLDRYLTNKYLRYIWLLFNHSILFNLLSHSFLIAQFKLSLLFMKFCTALKYFKKSLSTSNIKYIQSCQKLVNINSEEIVNVKKNRWKLVMR